MYLLDFPMVAFTALSQSDAEWFVIFIDQIIEPRPQQLGKVVSNAGIVIGLSEDRVVHSPLCKSTAVVIESD